MHQLILPAISILLLGANEVAEKWIRVPVRFKNEPCYHPIYRIADGSVAIRFRANLKDGKFESVECLDPQDQKKGLAKWFIPNVIDMARVQHQPNAENGIFEMRMCNCACNDNFPRGYSFWRLK